MFKKLLITYSIIFLLCGSCWAGVNFSGDADYINAGDLFDTDSTWSFCARVNNDDITSDGAIAANNDGSGVDDGFLFWRDDVANTSGRTNTYSVRINTTNADYLLEGASNASVAGVDTCVCFTYNQPSDELSLYVQGIEDANSPQTAGLGTMVDSNTDVSIGYFTAAGIWPFNGKINNPTFYSDVLTAEETLSICSSKGKRQPLQLDNLLQFLPLDDYADGTNLNTDANGYKDLSGNGNHGQGVDADTDSLNVAETVLTYP